MKVSVVVPVYNEEEYIEKCIESLLKQIEPAYEIIVVDNNSTDSTAKILKKFKVKVVKEMEQGIIPTRNRGFNTATGDIIARCDADSIVPEDWIKKIKENFSTHTIDALSGPIIYYDLPVRTHYYSDLFFYSIKQIQGFDTVIGPNMAIKKTIWRKIKDTCCTDPSIVHEDIDIAYHINEAGGTIFIDKDLVVQTSARRVKFNPTSFFVEYPLRVMKMLQYHKNLHTIT